MYRIRKRFTFAASHQLDHLPAGHQCARLHGHNYAVWLELVADALDEDGFVVDFGELAPFRKLIDDTLDHRHLNDAMSVAPTAEHLARMLFVVAANLWPATGTRRVAAVSVEETGTSFAEYRP